MGIRELGPKGRIVPQVIAIARWGHVRAPTVVSVVLIASNLLMPQTARAGASRTLSATVGDSGIAIRNTDGSKVRRLISGQYTIVVRDRSLRHAFHLVGPLIPAKQTLNRRTGVSYVGTTRWSLRLAPGEYRFFCDRHPGRMSGMFTVAPHP